MKRVMDPPNWPPTGGGAFDPKKNTFAVSAEEVTIKEFVRRNEKDLCFTGSFEETSLTYDFKAPDEKTAKKLATILENSVGKILFKVGFDVIPED